MGERNVRIAMRILLVEDEKRMAQALCEILRQEQYEVDWFANGSDGLVAVESNIYDIVILDVMLPGMNGSMNWLSKICSFYANDYQR